MTNKENITCPHCNKAKTWTPNNEWRPFCSERCKLIDLGDWADEKHRIPDESAPRLSDEDTEDNDV